MTISLLAPFLSRTGATGVTRKETKNLAFLPQRFETPQQRITLGLSEVILLFFCSDVPVETIFPGLNLFLLFGQAGLKEGEVVGDATTGGTVHIHRDLHNQSGDKKASLLFRQSSAGRPHSRKSLVHEKLILQATL